MILFGANFTVKAYSKVKLLKKKTTVCSGPDHGAVFFYGKSGKAEFHLFVIILVWNEIQN